METSLLAGLNSAQRAAVTSTSSILQVLAPPGSGKTKTLTTRVAYLLAHHGYNPQNVICCTFTIKAAREMRERLRGLVGCELESNLVLGTFHSICRRYLVAYGQLIAVRKGFGIADSSDTASIVKRIVKKNGYNIDPKIARARISSNKAKGKTVDDFPASAKHQEHQEFRQVWIQYEDALATSNLLDYDDLLLRCVDLLTEHPTCVSNIEALLIDEFQDTNVVQFELMKRFASARKRITIVGDPDQSIYGFRSAEIENLKRMKAYYPETVVISLEENYRSSSAVLRLAQDVIEQDIDRPVKKLKSTHCYGTLPVLRKLPNPHEEALWITSEIKRIMNMTGGLLQHSDIAVLIRSAYLSLLIEKTFTSTGIPYRMVGGMRFFDRAEIRLIVDYLRTISHPDNDSAFLSVINVPSRKIGDSTIASLVKLGEEKQIPLWEVVQKILTGSLVPDKKFSKPSEQDLQKLVNLIKEARQKMKATEPADVPSLLIEFVVSKVALPAYLQKKYKDDYEDRIENIQEFHTHAKDLAALASSEQLPTVDGVQQQQTEGSQEALDQFLATIVLSTEVENSEKGDDTPRVTISTIHSAKGLEWPIVFVPAVYEGSIPHSRAEEVDEERRLLYVAMTRAQALLTLTFPVMQSRDQGESTLTQFLPAEIHKRLCDRGPVFSDEVVADIAAILRQDMPSQEALTKGLQSLGENESAEDNIWPTDGTHRTTPGTQPLLPLPGMPLQDDFKLKSSGYQKASFTMSTSSWDSVNSVSTTMSNTAAFSTSNMSLGFTTASHQLKMAPPPLIQSTSNPVLERKKPKLEKTKSAQGSIASFFSLPTATAKAEETSAMEARKQWASMQPRTPEPSLPPMPVARKVESTIPVELSLHRLTGSSTPRDHSTSVSVSTSAKGGSGFKRPRLALEPTSPNTRKKYVFLSSSPPPEDQSQAQGPEKEKAKQMGRETQFIRTDDDENSNDGVSQPANTTFSKKPQVTSSHTTVSVPVTLIKNQSNAIGVKKTLGVRRTMNGWDARKNR